jgi:hypothetical protein
MTTLSVREYVAGIYRKLNLDSKVEKTPVHAVAVNISVLFASVAIARISENRNIKAATMPRRAPKSATK